MAPTGSTSHPTGCYVDRQLPTGSSSTPWSHSYAVRILRGIDTSSLGSGNRASSRRRSVDDRRDRGGAVDEKAGHPVQGDERGRHSDLDHVPGRWLASEMQCEGEVCHEPHDDDRTERDRPEGFTLDRKSVV